ncbi:MAG TPA: hypothetical protein VE010_01810, partial [Thermoanaerobaculia bacterium]|nr:hypothetical protein [Thermoanaerobaculia bacterium]
EVVDRAGHVGRGSHTLAVKTSKPLLDVVENGTPIVDGTRFTRAVSPQVRVFEEGVTFTATLNGAQFTNGTQVSADGEYTIVATATDPAYKTTTSITRRFTIDRNGPAVKIVAPANGVSVAADFVHVRVTAADAVSVSVNAIVAIKQGDGSWVAANVPLDLGETDIIATGRDAAGNVASDQVTVTRAGSGPAIVVTFPPDGFITNRPRLDVTGRVLRPGPSVSVTVPPANAVSTTLDPAGAFRLAGAELREGESTITATAAEGGKATSATVRVIADFTPPVVRILESGQELAEGASFASRAIISGAANDGAETLAFELVLDGNPVASPVTVTALGGHSVLIRARDRAGNESRLERTFTIGTSAAAGCQLEAFDPPHNATITSQKVELIGRSGGAAGVKVNGVAAKMASGSFCAAVELPNEGPNTVTIVCTDAEGRPTGEPVTITLHRVTNDPSVTITTPVEGFVTSDQTIVVTGTLGNGAVSVELNGKSATISGSTWTANDVRLQDGTNVLVARAKSAGGRTATASRRVLSLQDAPSIAISSPVTGFVSGSSRVDLTGTWSNVEPSSIAIENLAGVVEPTPWSDTTGRFIARDVPLQSGDNTIRITGRDRTGRVARAEVVVRYAATAPSVTIVEPVDNHYFGAAQGTTFRVSG